MNNNIKIMTEEMRRMGQRPAPACRLCMAPETECVSIFATAAADKEPLNSKIYACLGIKVQQGDRLPSKICHACISYLNSWQSFKNRCNSTQKRYRGLLEIKVMQNRLKLKAEQQQNQQTNGQMGSGRTQLMDQLQQQRYQQHRMQLLQPSNRILKNVLSQPSSSSSSVNRFHQQQQLLKQQHHNADNRGKDSTEDLGSDGDDNLDDEHKVDLDPLEFLARDDDDGDGGGDDGGNGNGNGGDDDDDDDDAGEDGRNDGDSGGGGGAGTGEDGDGPGITDGGNGGDDLMDDGENENDSDLDRNTFADEGPPILTSLGLTHINHVNPYSFLSTELGNATGGGNSNADASASINELDDDNEELSFERSQYLSADSNIRGTFIRGMRVPCCTICNMKFSNRANARRHERNIHGKVNSYKLQMQVGGTLAAGQRPPMKKVSRAPIFVFDYGRPEEYRHFLTEPKLNFIRRHLEFFDQYQIMSCYCCNKSYPTYKFFMAHMRKRYKTLSRNLCFKCLTQFETKPQFIAHLRKKNCINLYKLFLADPTISKDPIEPEPTPLSTKEFINNRVYGCKLCTKTFRLKLDFRGHVFEAHGEGHKKDNPAGACNFCNIEFDDPAERRRHHNNMECLSFLICGTCEEQFDNHPAFIDHVYSTHVLNGNVKSEYLGEDSNGGGGNGSGIPTGRNIGSNETMGGGGGDKEKDETGGGADGDEMDDGIDGGGSASASASVTASRRNDDDAEYENEQYDDNGNYYDDMVNPDIEMGEHMDNFNGSTGDGGASGMNQIPRHLDEYNSIPYTGPPRPQNPQRCKICGKQYNNYYNVLRHMETKHPDKLPPTYRCDPCGIGFPRQMELREHLHRVHNERIYSSSSKKRELFICQFCGAVYDYKDLWIEHQVNAHKRFKCHQCEMATTDRDHFEQHLAVYHKVKFYTCHICRHSFNSERGLATHLLVMHGVKREQTNRKHELAAKAQSAGNQNYSGESVDADTIGNYDDYVKIENAPSIKLEENDELNDDDEFEDGKNDVNGEENENDNDGGGDHNVVENEHENYIDNEDDNYDNYDDNEHSNQSAKRFKMDINPISTIQHALKTSTPTSARKRINTDQTLLPCHICGAIFCGGISLSNHMRSHSATSYASRGSKLPSGMPARATAVVAASSTSSQVSAERSHTISNYRIRCRICQKRIHTKLSYKRHMLEVHQVTDCVFIQCTLCPAEFSNDKGLKVHMFRTHKIAAEPFNKSVIRGIPVTGDSPIETQTAPPSTGNIKAMFECDICHTVYRSVDQLHAHKTMVHQSIINAEENTINDAAAGDPETLQNAGVNNELEFDEKLPVGVETFWQCRYCEHSFNARKKLTIHMNSHVEHDPTDNTCKDCGSVYSTRKSLWVHCHKKHPRLPNPSSCELCERVFYDKTELFYHLKTHSSNDVFEQLQELQVEMEAKQKQQQQQQQQLLQQKIQLQQLQKQKPTPRYGGSGVNIMDTEDGNIMPKVDDDDLKCHICSIQFSDKRTLSKHLRTHEQEHSFNPLVNMLADTTLTEPLTFDGASGTNEYNYKGAMVNGEFSCDICPKTFPVMTALKVHRGWHFRSPDGRQITDPKNIWQPGVNAGSSSSNNHSSSGGKGGTVGGAVGGAVGGVVGGAVDGAVGGGAGGSGAVRVVNKLGGSISGTQKPNRQHDSNRLKRSRQMLRPPVCPYCSSTFASGNNLRRHIVEVHKRNEAKLMRENGTVSDSIAIEKPGQCTACNLQFPTHGLWVEHKIADARTMKPSKTFEWGCEICGKVFTRKERLLAHMVSHVPENEQSEGGADGIKMTRSPSSTMHPDQSNDTAYDGNSQSSMSSQSQSYFRPKLEEGDDSNSMTPQQIQQKRSHHPYNAQDHHLDDDEVNDDVENDGDDDDVDNGNMSNNRNYNNERNEQEDDDEEEEIDHEQQQQQQHHHQQQQQHHHQQQQQHHHQQQQHHHQQQQHYHQQYQQQQQQEQEQLLQPINTQSEVSNEDPSVSAAYSCDLCQVFFHTAKELRRHVTSHIINGSEIVSPMINDGVQEDSKPTLNMMYQSTGNSSTSINSPTVIATNEQPIIHCNLCGTKCRTTTELKACKESHFMPTELRCSICHIFFTHDYQVVEHDHLCHRSRSQI